MALETFVYSLWTVESKAELFEMLEISYIWQNLGGVFSPMGGIALCLQPLSSSLFSW